MGKYNDIDILKWKDYGDIISDSLWIIKDRDKSGIHRGDYHGNFIPQIPYQLLSRYTKKGDWILDPFLGSGTTMIEAKRMNRNCIGIDLDPNILEIANDRVLKTKGLSDLEIIEGDSAKVEINKYLHKNNIKKFQFVIYHPPYWDIIKFNEIEGNLSSEKTLQGFLDKFEDVIDNTIPYLEKGRFFSIVIGDIYKEGEWIPLNSYITQLLLKKGKLLKSVVVKNMGETKAKQNKKALWRYRSLLGGFYVFSHEYILIFQNK